METDLASLAALGLGGGLVTKTAVDIIRYVRGKDWNGTVTLLIAWVGGVLATAAAKATDLVDELGVANDALSDLSAGSVAALGVTVGSVAAAVNEFFASRDDTRSTGKPHLLDDDGRRRP